MGQKPAKTPKTAHQAVTPQVRELDVALGRIRGLENEIQGVVEGMSEKVRQLEILNSLAGLLNSSLDTALVREKALETTCQLLRCETASLFLIDQEKQELYWESALGASGKALKESVRLPINDRSLAGFVAQTGQPLMINDVPSDPRHFKKAGAQTGFRTLSMLCMPLTNKGRTIGVIQAINKSARSASEPGGRVGARGWAEFSDDDFNIFMTLSYQVAVAIENAKLYEDLKTTLYETVGALAETIEKKDRYTGGHTKRVVYFSECICKYMDLTSEERENVRLGALLHDVGKIGVEDKILKKQAPLEEDEWMVMQEHPEHGYEIMSKVAGLKHVVAGMRYHHERWDGTGYPCKLKGEEIPMIARIISVADTYDAMVSTRPYRKGLDPKIAYDEIVKHSGTQFDPVVVEAFKKAFQHEKMGRGSGSSRAAPKLSNCD